jgi:hypothetical protein
LWSGYHFRTGRASSCYIEATVKSVWWHNNVISLYKIRFYMDFMLDS